MKRGSRVEGPVVKVMPVSRTIAFNKPYGVLPCFTDSGGRPTLADYIDVPGVYAAGRLDQDSEGLMILTSDGTLAHRITAPRHKLGKIYLAQVEREPNDDALSRLQSGVVLSGQRTRPAAGPGTHRSAVDAGPSGADQVSEECADRVDRNHVVRRHESAGPAHDGRRGASYVALDSNRHRADSVARSFSGKMARS